MLSRIRPIISPEQELIAVFHPDCANSQQCAPYKHHFDECVERVTRQQEDPDSNGPKEDCVEECKHTKSWVQTRHQSKCCLWLYPLTIYRDFGWELCYYYCYHRLTSTLCVQSSTSSTVPPSALPLSSGSPCGKAPARPYLRLCVSMHATWAGFNRISYNMFPVEARCIRVLKCRE
jgi:Ubiquinol-cytochrome C reductase hinge protein